MIAQVHANDQTIIIQKKHYPSTPERSQPFTTIEFKFEKDNTFTIFVNDDHPILSLIDENPMTFEPNGGDKNER